MENIKYIHGLILIFGLTLGLGSCRCDKDKKNDSLADSNAATINQALRLTPEQVSQQIRQALEFEYGWYDQNQRFHDIITEQFAVSLGGIDFLTASKRDPSTRVQTLLIVRRIAWDVASAVVWREANPDTNETILFTDCHLMEDRPIFPSEIQSGNYESLSAMDERWMTQLENFYWRLFSRPPSSEEIETIRLAAEQIYNSEPWPPTIWTMVLYSLLSTQEFWNI